jgi:hypothetical protein
MLSAEISTIYRGGERTRKVHHLIYAPTFEAADGTTSALSKIGNLASDGRPILGLDSGHPRAITLDGGPGCYLAPARLGPWFAVPGSKSGFDVVADCYGDLAAHVFAIGTGLSSDQAMNWMCSALDGYRLVSNSHAHSPPMLGCEATTFGTELDYFEMADALRTGTGLAGTIEFYPEEDKYHLGGHRKCGVRFERQRLSDMARTRPEDNTRLPPKTERPRARRPDGDSPAARERPWLAARATVPAPSDAEQHPGVAEGVRLHLIKVKELGNALVVRAEQLGVHLGRGSLAADLLEPVLPEELHREGQDEYPADAELAGDRQQRLDDPVPGAVSLVRLRHRDRADLGEILPHDVQRAAADDLAVRSGAARHPELLDVLVQRDRCLAQQAARGNVGVYQGADRPHVTGLRSPDHIFHRLATLA